MTGKTMPGMTGRRVMADRIGHLESGSLQAEAGGFG